MPIYAGVSGSNRKLTKVPVGVSGANRECKSVYAGVSGTNRQVFSSANCSISVSATEEDGLEGKYTLNSDKSITFTAYAKTTEKGNNGGCGIMLRITLNVPLSAGSHKVLVKFQNPSYSRDNCYLILREGKYGEGVSRPFASVVNDPQIGPLTLEFSRSSESISLTIQGHGKELEPFTATIPVGGILIDDVPMIPA